MNRLTQALLVVFFIFSSAACSKNSGEGADGLQKSYTPRGSENEPRRVIVQHILIGFKDSLPGKEIKRSKSEAKELAMELYQKAKNNPSTFVELVRAHSDDQVPGIYSMVNYGVEPKADEIPRGKMVAEFGAVSFALKAGQVAVAEYDKVKSPYGYHVIKRLE